MAEKLYYSVNSLYIKTNIGNLKPKTPAEYAGKIKGSIRQKTTDPAVSGLEL
jgi:hypothetical protein